MTIAAITNHVERGLSRLIDQYRDKPRLAAWITSYLTEVQGLSTAAWGVLVMRLLDDATGEQLTVLGRLAGQSRSVEDDERFRVLVRSRIAANSSRGRWNDLLRVARLLLGDGVLFSMRPHYPAALVLTIEQPVAFIPTLEHEMLNVAVAGGVRIDVHFYADGTDELFRFGDGPGWGTGLWAGSVSDH